MSRFFCLRLFLLLALATGGSLVRGQSFISNPVWKPYLRIKIPTVFPVESDGYVTNIQTFACRDTNNVSQTVSVTNITVKLNPLRNLKWCDFVVKAVRQHPGGDPEVIYVYHSTTAEDGDTGAPFDEAYADVYFLDTRFGQQSLTLRKLKYNKAESDSIQNQSSNFATHIEIWPDRNRLAQAGITARSRDVIWVCRLLNGVGEYLDEKSGKTKWFPVQEKWVQFAPEY